MTRKSANVPPPGTTGGGASKSDDLGGTVTNNETTPSHRAQSGIGLGWNALRDEAMGVFSVAFVAPSTMLELPPNLALAFASASVKWLELRRRASSKPICLLCPTEFSGEMPAAFTMISAGLSRNPKMIVLSGVCERCVGNHAEDVVDRAMEVVRETLGPDSREVSLSGEVGHG